MSAAVLDIREVLLDAFVVSQTKIQQERRKQRSKSDIDELAASFKTAGQIHPALARPNPSPNAPAHPFEIVAGEGRWLAAKAAGLTHLRTEVRSLTDEQVEEIQLIENLQRTGLHELVEAEGYEVLAKRGHSVDDIATRVGKSKATIYARMKLLELSADSRKAFREGKVSASIALLIARVDPKLQKEALAEILEPDAFGQPMSYREAADFMQRSFTFRLEEAGFDTKDTNLVPAAGACLTCPKRSGTQPELFSDIQRADVCTDPGCFRTKRDAHSKALLKNAKESGREVIAGNEAKRVVYHEGANHVNLAHEYVRPTDRCEDDAKRRTYGEILPDLKSALLKTPEGRVIEVLPRSVVTKALREKGVIKPEPKSTTARKAADPKAAAKEAAADRKLVLEAKFRKRVFRALFDKAPAKISRKMIEDKIAHELDYGDIDLMQMLEALGWDDFNMDRVSKELAKLSEPDLYRLVHVLPHAVDLGSWGNSSDLLKAAKAAGINTDKIRKELEAEDKAAAVKAPSPAKKKAARKPK